jgi:hypothetical protein
MSVVNSPTSRTKDRFGSPIIDEGVNDTERQLCSAVDAMLVGVNRVLQQSTNEKNAMIKLQGATTSFLRANGIRIRQESDSSNDEAGQARAAARAVARGSGSDAEAALRTQLEHCRDLLRKVDSERRHLYNQCTHLQGEQDQRRAEVEAIHRYSTEVHQRSLTMEHNVAEERQRRRQLEEQLDTQTQELMQLRRVLRALPGDLVASLNSPRAACAASSSRASAPLNAALPLVPDRRFEEAFRDKMSSIVYKRRFRRASALHQAAREQLESLLMEQQDPQYVGGDARWTLQVAAAAMANSEDSAMMAKNGQVTADTTNVAFGVNGLAEQHGGADVSTAAALASAVFWQSALDFPFQLPFSTATPQDALIKSLIYRSQYAEPLMQLREHTLRLSSRLKTAQDSGLRTLYTTFSQALRGLGATTVPAQYRSLYERQMDKMQRAHRELLYSLIEQVNRAATEIPQLEHSGGLSAASFARGGGGGGCLAVQRRDVGCSAQESVSVEEYRASQLKEQLTKLKLQSLEAAASALKDREATAAQCTAARQEALQALRSLKKLTACVAALMQGQKETAGVMYDPLEQVKEPITEEVLDDPRLVTKMVEATDLTLMYVRRLARSSAASPSTGEAPTAGKSSGRASPPHIRTSLVTSARLSSSLSFGNDTAGEDTYGHIIDIHRRDSAPNTHVTKHGRRTSAPPSLSNTVRRTRSKSIAAATATRRQTVPQLPAMTRTPKAPTTERGVRGRPGVGDTSAFHTPPPREDQKADPAGTSAALPRDLLAEAKETPMRPDGRSPNAAISVIDLGFSENNMRYT